MTIQPPDPTLVENNDDEKNEIESDISDLDLDVIEDGE